ncbi:hypothetical protein KUTeg_024766 [Tegillarca granosa]|uniref:Death domain-containing protein n=1 Tax=Tegillarca granosa TaxID=220873 RepID=A0ABQ9DZA7_TEGGR|nr:hypothetical protein KUTeg_024766 [Tegillarca granosa]
MTYVAKKKEMKIGQIDARQFLVSSFLLLYLLPFVTGKHREKKSCDYVKNVSSTSLQIQTTTSNSDAPKFPVAAAIKEDPRLKTSPVPLKTPEKDKFVAPKETDFEDNKSVFIVSLALSVIGFTSKNQPETDDEHLTAAELQAVAHQLAPDYYKQVGRLLGVTENEMRIIQANNPENVEERAYEVLKKWTEKMAAEATKKNLKIALKNINRVDVVQIFYNNSKKIPNQ